MTGDEHGWHVYSGDPASDPVGTVRDTCPDSESVKFASGFDLRTVDRYWIKIAPSGDPDPRGPWASLYQDADQHFMSDDAMDRYPVVRLDELLTPRMRRFKVKTVLGEEFVYHAEAFGGSENEVSLSMHDSGDTVFLKCPGGTLVNLAHVVSMEPLD